MAKDELMEFTGTLKELLPNAMCRGLLDKNHEIIEIVIIIKIIIIRDNSSRNSNYKSDNENDNSATILSRVCFLCTFSSLCLRRCLCLRFVREQQPNTASSKKSIL